MDSVSTFLEAFWGERLGELRFINRDDPLATRSEFILASNLAHTEFRDAIYEYNTGVGSDVYFGVTPRLDSGSGASVNCIDGHPWMWQDFDLAEGVYKTDALERALAPLATPSIIVDSGGGIQAYWKLDRNHDFAMRRKIMQGIAKKHGGDHTYDKARVMRLPGFVNHKYPDKPLARVLRFHPEQTYPISAFDEYIWEEPRVEYNIYTPASGTRAFSGDIGLVPLTLLSKITNGAPKGQRSELSFGVVCRLIELGWDYEDIEDVFKNPHWAIGEKYRERGNDSRWFSVTYAAAMQSVSLKQP